MFDHLDFLLNELEIKRLALSRTVKIGQSMISMVSKGKAKFSPEVAARVKSYMLKIFRKRGGKTRTPGTSKLVQDILCAKERAA
jgi:hypothetical protein